MNSMSSSPDKTVLIVDDDGDLRRALALTLEHQWSCRALEASSGPEAVALAQAEPVQVILMDLELPGFDGFEATRLIKAHPDRADVPVIAVSNHCWELDWKRRALKAGCVLCVDKGHLFEQLPLAVEPYLA